MSCQTCCKIFCSRRDKEENCSEKITYVEAGILEKVKVNKIRMDIEKDIKRCEKLTEPQNANWIGISNQIAIGHVIERIKELEEHQKKFYNGELYTAKQLKQIEENQKKYFINKQRVKELKESILLGPTIVGGRRNAKTLEYGIKLGKIKACEELLEDK